MKEQHSYGEPDTRPNTSFLRAIAGYCHGVSFFFSSSFESSFALCKGLLHSWESSIHFTQSGQKTYVFYRKTLDFLENMAPGAELRGAQEKAHFYTSAFRVYGI